MGLRGKSAIVALWGIMAAGCGRSPESSRLAAADHSSAVAGAASALTSSRASEPDWSADASVPRGTDRGNVYGLAPEAWRQAVRRGKGHALHYPVGVTGIAVPYRPFQRLLESEDRSWIQKLFGQVLGGLSHIHSMDELYEKLGMQAYPAEEGAPGPYHVPFPPEGRPTYRMGATLGKKDGADALTFSCAFCHAGTLFGRPVIGLTNRFPHANETFVKAKQALPLMPMLTFQLVSGASPAEMALLRQTKDRLRWVGAKMPQVLGLDTSLAQVALSLARRAPDAQATRTWASAAFPRRNALEHDVADSKPAVWWNLKYKTRWLSDGSLLSGNPVFTNFIWNELGRGTDLDELEAWLKAESDTVRDLTAAVFASEAPRYTDFFPAASLDEAAARRGQALFGAHCARCHGTYEKRWDEPGADGLPADARLATRRVIYHETTPVVDVGTDPGRYRGMMAFAADLNRLAISKAMGIVVAPQKGYVPPPLVGIWARWPYFHNNAAPSLCAVLTPGPARPARYYAGPADDPQRDFDAACNGYPSGDAVPEEWRTAERLYDSGKEGLGRGGHDVGIFVKDGQEILSAGDKADLIAFLKTL